MKKSPEQFRKEARREGSCLIHPSNGVARRVYQRVHGPLESDKFVCHRCDNPYCIDLRHLFVGTQKDNMQDCVRKGRINRQPHSDKVKKLISEASQRRWANPEYKKRLSEIVQKRWDGLTSEKREQHRVATIEGIIKRRRKAQK